MSERLARSLVTASALALVAVLALPARADVPPINVIPCERVREGDACTLESFPGVPQDGGSGSAGVCRSATCTRPDYAHWDRDASAMPPLMTYACLMCTASVADGGSGDAGGAGGAGGTGHKGGSGCALGGPGLEGSFVSLAPWALATGFAAAVLFLRRRRR
jgi:hypothetical protein